MTTKATTTTAGAAPVEPASAPLVALQRDDETVYGFVVGRRQVKPEQGKPYEQLTVALLSGGVTAAHEDDVTLVKA